MESSKPEIFNRIIKDAQEEADFIIDKAKKSANAIIEEQRCSARVNADKKAQSIILKAENDANIIRGKISTDIRNQAGWIVLTEKDRLITEVLNEVKNRLLIMQKSQDFHKALEKLIVKGSIVLGGGVLEVLINKNDSAISGIFNKLNKEITNRTGVETKLKLSKEFIDTGGVKIKTIDKKIVVDNTFEAIIRRRERELKLKIARILFSDLD